MALGKVFERFVQHSPVPVMLRGLMEFALPNERIDEIFRRTAQQQCERELLFSTVVETLNLAVCGVRGSVNAAYLAQKEKFSVSVISLYNKLKKAEPKVGQALVRETVTRLKPVIRSLKSCQKSPVPGLRVKILDGNHLAATERRVKETRRLNSVPLPGQALVVLEPEYRLLSDVFPCEDAHAQERLMLGDVLATVQENDLWIADRNFCTTGFLFGVAQRKAFFLIRQHASTLNGKELVGRRRRICRLTEGVLYEQSMRIYSDEGAEMLVRRITLVLDQPTRNGEKEINLLTNLAKRVKAQRVAQMYRERWTIENAFQELEQALQSEINTLCYPKAALLAFSVALVTYNLLSGVKAALRSTHGEEAAVEKLSGYYLAEEIGAVYGGIMVALPPTLWMRTFARLTARQMAARLNEIASHVKPQRFHKTTRGPQKPQPPRTGGYPHKHVSTARLLAQRRTAGGKTAIKIEA
jgi:IS4 transposase